MAKRHKKNTAPKPVSKKKNITKTQFDRMEYATRCILQLEGKDPKLLDLLSKKQKKQLFDTETAVPRVRAQKDSRIPPAFLRFMNFSLNNFLSTEYPNDKSIHISCLDMFCCGYSLLVNSINITQKNLFKDEQLKLASEISDLLLDSESCFENNYKSINATLIMLCMYHSRFTYRIYGMQMNIKVVVGGLFLAPKFEIIAFESTTAYFTHNGINRMAYAVKLGRMQNDLNVPIKVSIRKLFPQTTSDKMLPLYIQSHAIHRMKERLDCLPVLLRNYYMTCSLLLCKNIVQTPSGQLFWKYSYMEGITLGYFTFMIQNDKIFFTTFLPVVSEQTPEGRLLCRKLGINRQDINYLGMDKLSFFLTVDFDQIPFLKNALIECDMEGIMGIIRVDTDFHLTINEKKTRLVKSFFEKKQRMLKNQEKSSERVKG